MHCSAVLKSDYTGMDATCRPRRGYGSIPYVIVGLIQTAIMSNTNGTQAGHVATHQ